MPKILIIHDCYDCKYFDKFSLGYCLDKERDIENPSEFPEWCELEDADTEITGIPCSHVGNEGVCERCGEEVKDGCIGKE